MADRVNSCLTTLKTTLAGSHQLPRTGLVEQKVQMLVALQAGNNSWVWQDMEGGEPGQSWDFSERARNKHGMNPPTKAQRPTARAKRTSAAVPAWAVDDQTYLSLLTAHT